MCCYRAAAEEEVYSLRQVTQYPGFSPHALAAINTALAAWKIWQVTHAHLHGHTHRQQSPGITA